MIFHNIDADDRTGDFLFLSQFLGVLIRQKSQNNANFHRAPRIVFSLYTATIKDQNAFVFSTTWTALVFFRVFFLIRLFKNFIILIITQTRFLVLRVRRGWFRYHITYWHPIPILSHNNLHYIRTKNVQNPVSKSSDIPKFITFYTFSIIQFLKNEQYIKSYFL